MSDRILPRRPRETMGGWVFLPRDVDKIRLHLAGRLARRADVRRRPDLFDADEGACEAAGF